MDEVELFATVGKEITDVRLNLKETDSVWIPFPYVGFVLNPKLGTSEVRIPQQKTCREELAVSKADI
jgi:hypothetical protein